MAVGRIQDRVALITGGGTGIGRASGVLFAREGASVLVSGLDDDPLREVVDTIQRAGGCAAYVVGDVRRADDARRMVEATIEHFERLDILFNNAGIEFVASI